MIFGRERQIMKKTNRTIFQSLTAGLIPLVLVACSVEEPVSFASQVKPI
jgi:hypothetical protein